VKAYVVSPEAEADLKQIWRYLADEAGLGIADRIQSDLLDAFDKLAESLGIGHKRPDLTTCNVLFLIIYQYMVVYRKRPRIEIVRILHGKRNVARYPDFRVVLFQPVLPPQPGKAGKIAIGRVEHTAILDRQCSDLGGAHERPRSLSTDHHLAQYTPVILRREQQTHVWLRKPLI
jgi:plasmid stabilization system protein ParE